MNKKTEQTEVVKIRLRSAACFAVATGAILLGIHAHVVTPVMGAVLVAAVWVLFAVAAVTR